VVESAAMTDSVISYVPIPIDDLLKLFCYPTDFLVDQHPWLGDQ
jgi:hypothetical protein